MRCIADSSPLRKPRDLTKGYRVEPKLSNPFGEFDVDVWRLAAFQTKEEESIAFDSQHCRHNSKFTQKVYFAEG
jgi:hypothetical protein